MGAWASNSTDIGASGLFLNLLSVLSSVLPVKGVSKLAANESCSELTDMDKGTLMR